MKNVTKILTAVVLCAAVFASTQRTEALGGNAAFWPGDEANIAAFPAQINNHGFVQVTNMSNGLVDGVAANGSVGMVFSHGGSNWGLGFSDSSEDFFNLGWGKNGLGVNLGYKMWTDAHTSNDDFVAASCSDGAAANSAACLLVENQPETFACSDGVAADQATCEATVNVAASCSDGVSGDQATCEAVADCDANGTADDVCVWTADTFHTWDAQGTQTFHTWDDGHPLTYTGGVSSSGYKLSFGKDLGDWGEIGVHMTSGDSNASDWVEGMVINYTKSCGFWVFTDMVAQLDNPTDGDMKLDVDVFGHMDAGAADVMLAMGMVYDMADNGGMTLTSNLGVEAAVTDNVTVRGGMNWAYDLTNDAETGADVDKTGADSMAYSWVTGAGINFGSFNADFDLGAGFWGNPLGWVSGQDDDATWGNMTVTYSF